METLLLSIAGAIIILLLGVNGYFMKKWIESTEALTNSVNALKTAVALLKSENGNNEKFCKSRHDVIDKRLNAHSEKLNEHSESIAELRTIAPNIVKKN